jgi:reverse gyrase
VLIRAGFWNVRTYLQSGNRISRLWAFGTWNRGMCTWTD